MADVSDQQGDESFVVEPIQQLDGTPVPSAGQAQPSRWPQKQRLPGLIALAEGLALLGSFWLAPWFSWRAGGPLWLGHSYPPAAAHYLESLLANHNYTGWDMTHSIAIPLIGKSIAAFLPLWLIPLAAAALLVVAWLRWQKRLSDHLTLAALLALSALALLGELGFYLYVHNLYITFDARFDTSVSWGFWGAVGVTAAAIDAGITLLKFARFRVHAAHVQAGWRIVAVES